MKIDLGQSYSEMMPKDITEKKKHYPTFHIEVDEKVDLPEEGVMKIHFRKTASSVSERDGKKHYSCTVEVKYILDVEAEEDKSPTRKYNGAEDALDELMTAKMKERHADY